MHQNKLFSIIIVILLSNQFVQSASLYNDAEDISILQERFLREYSDDTDVRDVMLNPNEMEPNPNNQILPTAGNNGFVVTIRGKKINLCDPKILSGSASQFFTEYTQGVDFNSKLPLLLAFLQDPSALKKKYLGRRELEFEWDEIVDESDDANDASDE